MFDRIAHRYDLLNRLLSLGRDTAWRRRLAACLADRTGQRVLDLATGTADVLLDTCRDAQVLRLGAGLDPAATWDTAFTAPGGSSRRSATAPASSSVAVSSE